MNEAETTALKPPRVVVVSQLPPPTHGSTIMTARFMEALSINEMDAHIVQRPFSRTNNDVGRITIDKIAKIPLLWYRIFRKVREVRPDLAVLFITVGAGSFFVDCFILILFRLFKIKCVLYVHGVGLRRWLDHSSALIRKFARWSVSLAHGGIVLSKTLEDDVNTVLPADRILAIPNGVPEDSGDCGVDYFSRDNEQPYTVLFLSNLIPAKGPLNFLKVARRVCRQDSSIRFVLAGPARDPAFLSELEEFIEDARMADCVSVPGGVYGTGKRKLFAAADVFLFPTAHPKEAFPLVLLEAMQWGLPVISSFAGAIPDMVVSDVTGYVARPDDIESQANFVLGLSRDRKLREKMSRNARARYERLYSIDAYNGNVERAMRFFLKPAQGQEGKSRLEERCLVRQ